MYIGRGVVAMVVGWLAACGGTSAPAEEPTPAAPAVPYAYDDVVTYRWLGKEATSRVERVVLRAPGSEPRSPLRYAVDGEAKLLDVRIGVTRAGAGSGPAEDVALAQLDVLTDAQRSEDARVLAVVAVVKAATVPKRATPPHPIEAMGTLAGAQLVLAITTRGQFLRSFLPAGHPSTPLLARSLADGLLVPLPEEAVGVGARWSVRRLRTFAGRTVAEDVTYQLVERSAELTIVTLHGTVDRFALVDGDGPIASDDGYSRGRARLLALAGGPIDPATKTASGAHGIATSLARPGLGLNLFALEPVGAAAAGPSPALGLKVLVADPRVGGQPGT